MVFKLNDLMNLTYTIFKRCNGNKEGVSFLGSFFYFNLSVIWSLVGMLLLPFFPFVFNSVFGFVLGVIFFMVKYFVLGYKEVDFKNKYSLTQLYLFYALLIIGSISLVGINIFLAMQFGL